MSFHGGAARDEGVCGVDEDAVAKEYGLLAETEQVS